MPSNLNDRVMTRQVVRAKLFALHFHEITQKFGGEPRRARRKIARRIAKKTWSTRRVVVRSAA